MALATGRDDGGDDGVAIAQHVSSGNAQGRKAVASNNRVTPRITLGLIAAIMPFAIDLNIEPRFEAREIK